MLKQSSNGETIAKRPLFVTTVPTGIFLQPCRHDISTTSSITSAANVTSSVARHTYSYFSVPRILANMRTKSQFGRRLGNDVLIGVSTATTNSNNNNNTKLVASSTRTPKLLSNNAPKSPVLQQQSHKNIMR